MNMVSIIIIEYFSLDEIGRFLQFIDGFGEEDIEVIVSSNSQYSMSEQVRIRKEFPRARWSFNERNGGFAYGMNNGLMIANGGLLVIMNPDVNISNSFAPMIEYLQKHPKVGLVAPKIVDKDGIVQDSFRFFFSPWGFLLRQMGWIKSRGTLKVKNVKEPLICDWVIGAFMMCRRDFYEKVGGFSEDYFMYCEDMDWCKRAHLAGYDVVYYPDCIVEYKGTRAARKSWKYAKIHIKSLLTYWRKFGFWG